MVDAAIVMIENAHKQLEAWQRAAARADGERAGELIARGRRRGRAGAVLLAADHHAVASCRCSRCEAQEGRLFAPLAYTKTYAMAAAAALSVTLVPVLMGYLIRGRIRREDGEPGQPRC
ncbi:MAG: efflux RND transporter permease subunit [Comamonadaceae bacterium]|nr:efflux RND transporter permease subunit [Comamonadaceae bacterium]